MKIIITYKETAIIHTFDEVFSTRIYSFLFLNSKIDVVKKMFYLKNFAFSNY